MYRFNEIDLGSRVWGHAYKFEWEESIDSELEVFSLLDQICAEHKLEQLGDSWNSITVEEAQGMISKGLRYDIAYNSPNYFEPGEVEAVESNLFKQIKWEHIRFAYTNCFGNPWTNSGGFSWNSLTQQTFDVGIVVAEKSRLFFIYFMSED